MLNNLNDYDQGYNDSLNDERSRRYNPYIKVTVDISDSGKGKLDALQRKPRNPELSNLAKDETYQAFMSKCAKVNNPGSDAALEIITVEWCTGGASGGNCWGDSPEPRDGDEPEELVVFDKIIEAVVPDISFLKYKNLCNEVMKSTTYTQSEYYGNYYNYSVKYVIIYDLFRAFKNRDLI